MSALAPLTAGLVFPDVVATAVLAVWWLMVLITGSGCLLIVLVLLAWGFNR